MKLVTCYYYIGSETSYIHVFYINFPPVTDLCENVYLFVELESYAFEKYFKLINLSSEWRERAGKLWCANFLLKNYGVCLGMIC